MASPVAMGVQAGAQALRFGWYWGLKQVAEWQTSGMAPAAKFKPRRPVPSQQSILADLVQLFLRDAAAVRDGIYPPFADGLGPLEHLARARAMLADMPHAVRRREARHAGSVRDLPESEGLPEYFRQDFHFQTGGYLSQTSARLYDTQVETLFLGGAAPMRREALRPIHEHLEGRDQRRVKLLDVACGTGRFLREARLAYPALGLTGLDLSPAYLDEARRHMGDLRPAALIHANAEAIPLPSHSQDIVTTIFLFHELPPSVRRQVTAEMARVLRPGGLLVLIDSLQMGDRAGWDGLLEAFPVRFHEPYFRQYAIDDLDDLFASSGLAPKAQWTSFLAKVMVRAKT